MSKKRAYIINETVKNDKGEYIPCIVEEDMQGYYLTDWAWGKDLEVAEKIADEKNEGLGISKVEANVLRDLSMFPNGNAELLRKHYEKVYGGKE